MVEFSSSSRTAASTLSTSYPSLCPLPALRCLRLGRACAAIEQSLTPDGARGLPVWGQDIRWSLLGFAFEQSEGANEEESEGRVGEKKEGQPSYLDWMEIRLKVIMLTGLAP